MTRKRKGKENRHTNPDHRPMLPVLRQPLESLDDARNARRRLIELEPDQYMKWR